MILGSKKNATGKYGIRCQCFQLPGAFIDQHRPELCKAGQKAKT